MTTQELLLRARGAKDAMALADTETKNRALLAMADALEAQQEEILAANAQDLEAAQGHHQRRDAGPAGPDPGAHPGHGPGHPGGGRPPRPGGRGAGPGGAAQRPGHPNKVAVPMGVIAIIYESRPNVTSDAAALALKAGSACVLRGGKEAHRSAAAIVAALKEGLSSAGLPSDALQLVEDTTRQSPRS